jgi:hypothetical protein
MQSSPRLPANESLRLRPALAAYSAHGYARATFAAELGRLDYPDIESLMTT